MPELNDLKKALTSEKAKTLFEKIYGNQQINIEKQTNRYMKLLENFSNQFPECKDVELFSTPGRTEVGGNHTDHNGGRVLAAAVNLDVIAAAAKNDTGIITVQSEGYPKDTVDINQLAPVAAEKYTSAALIRGICARLQQLGYKVGGFTAFTTSNVLKGSGLSSSAAFEVLIVSIISHLYNDGKIDDILNAQIAQYAENDYFGKPCGLMDQTTCSVGGFVTIDFKDFENPVVKKVDYDFSKSQFTMVIVDTGGNHADLNEDYAALEHEMKEVARALGGQVLREFTSKDVLDNISFLRTKVSDRAILRSLHFFADDQRVVDQVETLEKNDFGQFMKLIIESGYSSWMLCQNCYSCSAVHEQGISVALAVTESMLQGKGAWRVHGGGFAGTIQAFVPGDLLDHYLKTMKNIFGDNSCHELIIRPFGNIKLSII